MSVCTGKVDEWGGGLGNAVLERFASNTGSFCSAVLVSPSVSAIKL